MRAAVMAAAMACVVSTGARASVASFTATLGTFDPYYSELDQNLPGFDATLGTLSSITVSTRAYLSETVRVQQASGPLPLTGAFSAIYNAQVIGTPVSDRSVITQSAPTKLDENGLGLVGAAFTDSFIIPVADYPITSGPLTVRYDIFALPQGGLSFPSDSAFRTTAGGTVTVDYTYAATAVPEPASLALLGTALAFMRRPRKPYTAVRAT